MNQNCNRQRDIRKNLNLALIALTQPHDIEDVDNEIRSNDAHIPRERRCEIQAYKHVPNALNATQINQNECAGAQDAYRRGNNGRHRNLFE